MTTTLLPQPINSSAARKQARMVTAPAFRLLGLQPREARLEVIRRAVRNAAVNAQPPAGQADGDRLAQIATAAYRLLDPRRRPNFFERVQLVLWNEDEPDDALGSFWDQPSMSRAESARTASTGSMPRPPVQPPVGPSSMPPVGSRRSSLTSKSLPSRHYHRDPSTIVLDRMMDDDQSGGSMASEETRAALELFRSIRHRDRRAIALWISIVALAASLTLALTLVTAFL